MSANLFEREANNFARFALFQGDGYGRIAADHALEIKTPIKLVKKFGASIYASCREFARSNHRPCLVYICEPIGYCDGSGDRAVVRRVEPSPSFEQQFGRPTDTVITLDHFLGEVLPIHRKMTRPRSIAILDRNSQRHECVVEAFDTTFNVVILLYPVKALTASTLVLPPGSESPAGSGLSFWLGKRRPSPSRCATSLAGGVGRSWRSGCVPARPSRGRLAWRVDLWLPADFLRIRPSIGSMLPTGRSHALRNVIEKSLD